MQTSWHSPFNKTDFEGTFGGYPYIFQIYELTETSEMLLQLMSRTVSWEQHPISLWSILERRLLSSRNTFSFLRCCSPFPEKNRKMGNQQSYSIKQNNKNILIYELIKNKDAYQCTLSCYAAAEGYLAPCSYRKGRKMSML